MVSMGWALVLSAGHSERSLTWPSAHPPAIEPAKVQPVSVLDRGTAVHQLCFTFFHIARWVYLVDGRVGPTPPHSNAAGGGRDSRRRQRNVLVGTAPQFQHSTSSQHAMPVLIWRPKPYMHRHRSFSHTIVPFIRTLLQTTQSAIRDTLKGMPAQQRPRFANQKISKGWFDVFKEDY